MKIDQHQEVEAVSTLRKKHWAREWKKLRVREELVILCMTLRLGTRTLMYSLRQVFRSLFKTKLMSFHSALKLIMMIQLFSTIEFRSKINKIARRPTKL